jgi:hypothetical protein
MITNQFFGPIASVIVITSFLAFFTNCNMAPAKQPVPKAGGNGFAVLELFTSEGCSSCPPADELMARIQQESQGKAIYILAYHVDYWNRLGWKDSFSDADYSMRQIQYGRWLNQPQIYTPQVIINGKAEFVGSDETTIRSAIAEQLATQQGETLALQAEQNNGNLKVQYRIAGVAKGQVLLIAVIQKTAKSNVERGENAGRTLSHVQIVRKLQIDYPGASGDGSVTTSLPKDFNAQNWEVMGLVQDQGNGEILAAAKAQLSDSSNARK